MNDQPGLWSEHQQRPLAERMRPASFDEVLGHQDLVGTQGVLRSLVESGDLPSLVLWGPPGSGKTTIARLLCEAADAKMVSFSAVLSGVKEVRSVMAEAQQRQRFEDQHTALFVDEIHRFNKAQQDAFLPHVEAGTITLLGATTENPSFELNRALLSRLKVYTLNRLEAADIFKLIDRTMTDCSRGLGKSGVVVVTEAKKSIAKLAGGDARQAMNVLETVVALAKSEKRMEVDAELVVRAAQSALAAYDKNGEEHFNLISALHKSVRNSDVNAALYWLGRMLAGGADARYIVRRLLRIASEDIGMADPRALDQVTSAALVVEHVGLPECDLALAQSVVYLALAPKSNSVYRAMTLIKGLLGKDPGEPVPLHLRNAPTRLMKDQGYGEGYSYAHDSPTGVSNMDCLPAELKGARFFNPGSEGWEKRIRERLEFLDSARKQGSKGTRSSTTGYERNNSEDS